jgi:hypothetical protein
MNPFRILLPLLLAAVALFCLAIPKEAKAFNPFRRSVVQRQVIVQKQVFVPVRQQVIVQKQVFQPIVQHYAQPVVTQAIVQPVYSQQVLYGQALVAPVVHPAGCQAFFVK